MVGRSSGNQPLLWLLGQTTQTYCIGNCWDFHLVFAIILDQFGHRPRLHPAQGQPTRRRAVSCEVWELREWGRCLGLCCKCKIWLWLWWGENKAGLRPWAANSCLMKLQPSDLARPDPQSQSEATYWWSSNESRDAANTEGGVWSTFSLGSSLHLKTYLISMKWERGKNSGWIYSIQPENIKIFSQMRKNRAVYQRICIRDWYYYR